MKKESFIKMFRILIFFVTAFALVLNFILFKNWVGILYYTIISNVMVLFFYGYTLFSKKKNKLLKNEAYNYFRGLMVTSISTTMIVYNVFIGYNSGAYIGHTFESVLVHVVVPFLVLIENGLYIGSYKIKYKYLLYWSFILFEYYVFTVVYSFLGGTYLKGISYPYALIDFNYVSIFDAWFRAGFVLALYNGVGALVIKFNNRWSDK